MTTYLVVYRFSNLHYVGHGPLWFNKLRLVWKCNRKLIINSKRENLQRSKRTVPWQWI